MQPSLTYAIALLRLDLERYDILNAALTRHNNYY